MAEDRQSDFDVDEFIGRLKVHSPEFAAHHNEVISRMPTQCPAMMAHMECFSADPIDVAVLSGYEALMATARDYQVLSSAARPEHLAAAKAGAEPLSLPPYSDPPTSLDYRKIINPYVTPGAVAELEPRIRRLVSGLVDRFIERGEADLVRDLAQPVTALVTMWVAGLPEEKWRFYSEPIHRMLWRDGDMAAIQAEKRAALDELSRDIDRTHADRDAQGVIAATREALVDGRAIERWEIEGLVWLLLVGGVDTTQALFGSAGVFLGRHDAHRRQLIEDPALIPDAVEEFLRFHAPVLGTPRRAARDIEVEGVKIAKGTEVLACWAAANRDPAAFDRPNEVIFDRPENRHMTFSVGPHRCMGSNVARLELRAMLEEVLARLPDFELVERDLVFAPDVAVIYGYKNVPVTFTPGPRKGEPDSALEGLMSVQEETR